MSFKYAECGLCKIKRNEKRCRSTEGKGPDFCPTIHQEELIKKVLLKYEDPEIREFARQAAIQEGECFLDCNGENFIRHAIKPRIQEIVEFAWRMNYKLLGLAFCSGLQMEGNLMTQFLKKQGFEVVSVACKVGAVPKETIGVLDNQKLAKGKFEPMCNPIAQAEILNDAGTDFNIMLGLCVGHDSLFIKNIKAPTTVFAVKDRVLGNNPLAALYACDSYYEWLMKTDLKSNLKG
jgi:uncharacterized metal-binding protein